MFLRALYRRDGKAVDLLFLYRTDKGTPGEWCAAWSRMLDRGGALLRSSTSCPSPGAFCSCPVCGDPGSRGDRHRGMPLPRPAGRATMPGIWRTWPVCPCSNSCESAVQDLFRAAGGAVQERRVPVCRYLCARYPSVPGHPPGLIISSKNGSRGTATSPRPPLAAGVCRWPLGVIVM